MRASSESAAKGRSRKRPLGQTSRMIKKKLFKKFKMRNKLRFCSSRNGKKPHEASEEARKPSRRKPKHSRAPVQGSWVGVLLLTVVGFLLPHGSLASPDNCKLLKATSASHATNYDCPSGCPGRLDAPRVCEYMADDVFRYKFLGNGSLAGPCLQLCTSAGLPAVVHFSFSSFQFGGVGIPIPQAATFSHFCDGVNDLSPLEAGLIRLLAAWQNLEVGRALLVANFLSVTFWVFSVCVFQALGSCEVQKARASARRRLVRYKSRSVCHRGRFVGVGKSRGWRLLGWNRLPRSKFLKTKLSPRTRLKAPATHREYVLCYTSLRFRRQGPKSETGAALRTAPQTRSALPLAYASGR